MGGFIDAGKDVLKKNASAMTGGLSDVVLGGVERKPDTPGLPTPPDPSVVVDADAKSADMATAAAKIDEQARQSAEEDERNKRRGRAATVLTGERGAGTPVTATKTLLGE